jgi:alcohol dehydrogenase class IV
MRFNVRRKPELYYRVGLAMGKLDAISGVNALFDEIGITSGLRAAGVRDDQLDALADAAFADSCHKTNPVPVTRDDLRALYQQAM